MKIRYNLMIMSAITGMITGAIISSLPFYIWLVMALIHAVLWYCISYTILEIFK